MTPGPTDGKVLLWPADAGKYIADRSTNVFINDQAIVKAAGDAARAFKDGQHSLNNFKALPLHPDVANETAIDFIFAVDTLNFSFWSDNPEEKYKVKYKGEFYSGYWSIVAALKRAEDEGRPVFSAKYMSSVEKDEFAHILRSDSSVQISLLEERLHAFNEAGQVLLGKYDGSFSNCIRSCNKDAVQLVKRIAADFGSFRDEAVFDDQPVAFYKRAQIAVADIWLCFEGQGLGEFRNIDQLTMFADYRVPQTLEYFGILQYSKELKQKLDGREVLLPGSRTEGEIRGCSIEAVERLKNETKKLLLSDKSTTDVARIVNSITMDNYLWDYAAAHRAEMAHLMFHRVRTIFY
uniref:Queuosine 5'-phosphate N-glycosylase/hydrolase n=1 Tax=Ciona intestinalis TaxID=7719 RepID=F7B0X0_CIOIN|nr:queuosine salvage protein-like [Ciona intestinalis]|eukprot:XP_002129448.1 queuosine salvage protein-like [Ciona intestinalis]